MTSFDVLNPKLELNGKFFVEASAGCGKTFSIEHAFVRFLVEADPEVQIDHILVLTFTNEATSELKARIYSALKEVYKQFLCPSDQNIPYIVAWQNQPHKWIEKKRAVLKEALSNFDSAQIYTIHKFCFLKLKHFLFDAHLSLNHSSDQKEVNLKLFEQIVKDYLTYCYDKKEIHPQQIELLIQYHQKDFNRLLRSLVYELSKEHPHIPFCSYKELSATIRALVDQFKQENFNIVEFLGHLENDLALFKGTVNRHQQLNEDTKASFDALFNLLTLDEFEEQLAFLLPLFQSMAKTFKTQNLKKKANPSEKTLQLITFLETSLYPVLHQMTAKEPLLINLLAVCQKLYRQFFKTKKILSPNSILKQFNQLLENPSISGYVASQYKAAIVDEFQDTDPTQWEILSKLFLNPSNAKKTVMVVGDPKQAIYGFRKADIYTYLKASEAMGLKKPYTLNTNYRSQPNLITALNHLFTTQKNHWLNLPKLNRALPYDPVGSFSKIKELDFKDELRSIHFSWVNIDKRPSSKNYEQIEKQFFFPFIVHEIQKIRSKTKLNYDQFAVLVSDRFQSMRLQHYLKQSALPFSVIRPESLQGKNSVFQFLQIFQAVLFPENRKFIFSLKVNTLLNWPLEHFQEARLYRLSNYFIQLKQVLIEQGFIAFYKELCSLAVFDSPSLIEDILSQDGGIYLFQELEQIQALLVEKQLMGFDAYQLLHFLKELANPRDIVDQTFPLRQNIEEYGVQILTMHMSKGLEFEVVFALGASSPVKIQDRIVEDENEVLKAFDSLSEGEKRLIVEEQYAEKLRTLYVAYTRAKQRLYALGLQSKQITSLKNISSLELLFHYQKHTFDSLSSHLARCDHISMSALKESPKIENLQPKENVELQPPSPYQIHFKKRYKHSFSSLSKAQRSNELLSAPTNFEIEDKTVHTLPAGAKTGNLIHQILENVAFDQPVDVSPWIEKTPYEPWKKVIDEMVRSFLNTPIFCGQKKFLLNELERKKIYKETEFLYPCNKSFAIEGQAQVGDFLHGFIDLIFEVDEKVYILDYKTNWLGPDESYYENLTEAMSSHQYYLQAKIYQRAILRYLDAFPKKRQFGGVIYGFMRGIKAKGHGFIFLEAEHLV